MSYRFSQTAGRAVRATQSLGQGLKPLQGEKPPMVYGTGVSFAQSNSSSTSLANPKIKEMQKLFQKEDSVPVHVKRGQRDKIFYGATWALTAICTSQTFLFWYTSAFP